MKIIFVIPVWSYRGGEKIFIEFAKGLHQKGHEVVIIAGRKEKFSIDIPGGIEVYYPRRFKNFLANNLFYFFFSWIFIYLEILPVLKGTDWIITESNNCLLASILARFTSPRTQVAWYVLAYESVHFTNRFINFIWEATFGIIERILVTRVAVCFSLAPRVRSALLKRFRLSSTVLYPIVEFAPSQNTNLREDLKKIYKGHEVLFLPGALHWKKNQAIAIVALASLVKKYPSLRLVIAGSGSEETSLKKLANESGVGSQVFFASVIGGKNLQYCYKNSVATLVCSVTENEGLSLTSFESLYYSTPVIVSSEAGVASYIKKQGIGTVVPPTAAEFSVAISALLKNPQKFRKIATLSRQHIISEFNSKKRTALLLRLLPAS